MGSIPTGDAIFFNGEWVMPYLVDTDVWFITDKQYLGKETRFQKIKRVVKAFFRGE